MGSAGHDRLWSLKFIIAPLYMLFFRRKETVMRSKITVVGAGFVGSTLVQRLVERDYADVVMFDIIPNMPQGKALDILQAVPVLGYDSLIAGTNDYADTAN